MDSSASTDTMNQRGPYHDNRGGYRLRRKRASPGNSSTSLGSKLAGDALAGAAASFVVSPFVAVVDKAIVQKANGVSESIRASSLQTLRGMVVNPVAFAKSPAFLYVWAVYASTFAVANGLQSWSEHSKKKQGQSSASTTTIGPVGIFLGTSATNIATSVLKDRAYSRIFVAAASDAVVTLPKVPRVTYGLWMARDSISVGSAFLLPPLVASKLSQGKNGSKEDEKRLRDACQLCVPMAAPIVSAPFHLLGLDLVNRPLHQHSWKQTILERGVFLANGYTAVVAARMARIVPGFGVGGVLNAHLRDGWRSVVVDSTRYATPMTHQDLEDHAMLPTAVRL